MTIKTESTEPSRLYARAYDAHYSGRDLPLAMRLYRTLLTSFPNDPEAVYAQKQVQNIAHAIVPKQDLLEAQLALVLSYLEHDERTEQERHPVNPLRSEFPFKVGDRAEQLLDDGHGRRTIVSAS